MSHRRGWLVATPGRMEDAPDFLLDQRRHLESAIKTKGCCSFSVAIKCHRAQEIARVALSARRCSVTSMFTPVIVSARPSVP